MSEKIIEFYVISVFQYMSLMKSYEIHCPKHGEKMV